MNIQSELLALKLQDWMGKLEQVDDIVVMGVRIWTQKLMYELNKDLCNEENNHETHTFYSAISIICVDQYGSRPNEILQ